MTQSAPITALLLATLVCACAGSDDGIRWTTRDSAGIQVVESVAPAWESELEWHLSAEPSLSIGAQDGDPAYLFHGIVGAKRLSDGRIAVADYGSNQIRFFDSTGRFLTSVGREGDGPGEFRLMSLFWRLPGDTLVVSDSRRLTLFDAGGTYIRSVRLEATAGGFTAQAVGQLDDGTILGFNGTRGISPADAGALIGNTLQLHVFREDGSYGVLLDSVPAAPLWFIEGTTDLRRVPFHTFPARAAAGAHVYLARGGEPQIELWRGNGTLERIIRWRPPSRTLTSEHIDRYRVHLLESTSNPNTRRRHEQFLAEVPMPEEVPALGEASFQVDATRHLWAEAYRPEWVADTEWLVFSPEGEWLGSVHTPARFVLHDVGADFILGVWRDDLGVDYVRLYELIKP